MDVQPTSMISKIPSEILLEIFHPPQYLVDEVYEGNDWISYAAEAAKVYPPVEVKQAEKQQNCISLVCKSWYQLASTIKDRFVHRGPEKSLAAIVKARYVYLDNIDWSLPDLTGIEVPWRVLSIPLGLVKQMQLARCPNLRRLEIVNFSSLLEKLDVDQLVETLEYFKDITWFGFHSLVMRTMGPFGHDGGRRVTMKNIQTVHCVGNVELRFPYYRLDLPALRHLSISVDPYSFFPLLEIIEAYGKSLHSLYVNLQSGREIIPTDPQFPDWSNVPHLQELAIDAPLYPKYHPLPSTHPLRVFAATVLDVNSLSSWIDSENLKEIRIIKPRFSRFFSITEPHPDDIRALEEKARLKGITVRTCDCAIGNET